jgi:hypothetical protein
VEIGEGHRPFPKEKSKIMVFKVAQDINGLYNHNIVHPDLKHLVCSLVKNQMVGIILLGTLNVPLK